MGPSTNQKTPPDAVIVAPDGWIWWSPDPAAAVTAIFTTSTAAGAVHDAESGGVLLVFLPPPRLLPGCDHQTGGAIGEIRGGNCRGDAYG